MSNLNQAPHIAARVASFEVINESGDVVSSFGPYDNALTDGYAFVGPAGSFRINLGGQISLYSGVRYPIKYRGPAPATLVSGVLSAPGLLADYGVDSSGLGYVNSPTLSGKVVKFDSGEEYYISGVLSGQIIIRNGGRIRTRNDVQNGAFSASSPWSWFYPQITGDISSPTNYTVWDVGGFAENGGYGELPAISSTTLISNSVSFFPTYTGVYGVYTGGIVRLTRFETAALTRDFNIGKVSIDREPGGATVPTAHVNVGGSSGIQLLSGQRVRIGYEAVFDITPMFNSLTRVHSTPIFSGIPNSSGYFIPFAGSQAQNSTTSNYGNNSDLEITASRYSPSFVDAFYSAGGENYAIYGNAMVYNANINATVPLSGAAMNITGSVNRSLSINTGFSSSVTSTQSSNVTGLRIFTGGKCVSNERQNVFVGLNDWNGTIHGIWFNSNNGAGMLAFYEPIVKDPAYELRFSYSTTIFERKLIN